MTDQWATAQRLVGRWEGTAEGEPGTGRQVRTYEHVLRGGFVLGTDRTVWAPTEADPGGEIHEDLSMLGYDKAAGVLVMRSFFVEGFACEYRCVEMAEDGSRFILEADRVENGGSMRARETFTFHGNDELESAFALAQGEGPFELYTTEHLHRVASSDPEPGGPGPHRAARPNDGDASARLE